MNFISITFRFYEILFFFLIFSEDQFINNLANLGLWLCKSYLGPGRVWNGWECIVQTRFSQFLGKESFRIPRSVKQSVLWLTREVHRSELTDLNETYQTGAFDDGNHGGKVKNRQIGAWNQAIRSHFSLVFVWELSKFVNASEKSRIFVNLLLPNSRLLFDFPPWFPSLKTPVR